MQRHLAFKKYYTLVICSFLKRKFCPYFFNREWSTFFLVQRLAGFWAPRRSAAWREQVTRCGKALVPLIRRKKPPDDLVPLRCTRPSAVLYFRRLNGTRALPTYFFDDLGVKRDSTRGARVPTPSSHAAASTTSGVYSGLPPSSPHLYPSDPSVPLILLQYNTAVV